jgi:hypothetical protein
LSTYFFQQNFTLSFPLKVQCPFVTGALYFTLYVFH